MIDLHSHVLPGLDDGPPDLEGSLALARAAAAAGTTVLAATPHLRSDHPFDPACVRGAVEELNRRIGEAGIALEVVPGGEVAITTLVEMSDEDLARARLGGGPFVLVESPYTPTGELLERALFQAQVRGVQLMLAHPERSPCFVDDIDRLETLVGRGVLCSVTAGSMAGGFGPTARETAIRLFERGLVHDVASDAHSAERRRPGLLGGFDALEEELPGLRGQAEWFTRDAPAAILAGGDLPPRPDPPVRRERGWREKLRGLAGSRRR